MSQHWIVKAQVVEWLHELLAQSHGVPELIVDYALEWWCDLAHAFVDRIFVFALSAGVVDLVESWPSCVPGADVLVDYRVLMGQRIGSASLRWASLPLWRKWWQDNLASLRYVATTRPHQITWLYSAYERLTSQTEVRLLLRVRNNDVDRGLDSFKAAMVRELLQSAQLERAEGRTKRPGDWLFSTEETLLLMMEIDPRGFCIERPSHRGGTNQLVTRNPRTQWLLGAVLSAVSLLALVSLSLWKKKHWTSKV